MTMRLETSSSSRWPRSPVPLSRATRTCEELLGCVGRVHPSTLEFISLSGSTVDGDEVHGQAQISYGTRAFRRVWLDQGEVTANEDAVRSIIDADLVVLGPGSLFTSIMPNILVHDIREALVRTKARRVFVCPKIDSLGETSGMSAADHVRVLLEEGLEGALDAVLVHRAETAEQVYPYEPRAWKREARKSLVGPGPNGEGIVTARQIERAKDAPFGPIRADDDDLRWLRRMVPRVIVRDFTGTGYAGRPRCATACASSGGGAYIDVVQCRGTRRAVAAGARVRILRPRYASRPRSRLRNPVPCGVGSV